MITKINNSFEKKMGGASSKSQADVDASIKHLEGQKSLLSTLRSQIASLNASVGNTKQESASCNNSLDQLREQMLTKRRSNTTQINSLTAQRDSIQASMDSILPEVSVVNTSIKKLESQEIGVKAGLRAAMSKVKNYELRVADLKSDITNKKETIKELEKSITKINDDLRSVEGDTNFSDTALIKQREDLKRGIDGIKKNIEKANAKLTEINNDVAGYTGNITRLRGVSGDLNTKLSTAQTSKSQAVLKKETLEKTKQALTAEVNALVTKSTNLNISQQSKDTFINAAKNIQKSLFTNVGSLTTDNTALQRSIFSNTQSTASAKTKFDNSLAAQKQAAKTALDAIQRKIVVYNKTILDLQTDIKTQQNKNTKLKQEEVGLRDAVNSVNTQIGNFITQKNNVSVDVRNINQQISVVRKNISTLKSEILQILSTNVFKKLDSTGYNATSSDKTLQNSSLDACVNACAENSTCQGLTIQGTDCILRTNIGNPITKSGHTSYVKYEDLRTMYDRKVKEMTEETAQKVEENRHWQNISTARPTYTKGKGCMLGNMKLGNWYPGNNKCWQSCKSNSVVRDQYGRCPCTNSSDCTGGDVCNRGRCVLPTAVIQGKLGTLQPKSERPPDVLDSPPIPGFILHKNKGLYGATAIQTKEVNNLQECADQCTKTQKCAGFEFFKSDRRKEPNGNTYYAPVCKLVERFSAYPAYTNGNAYFRTDAAGLTPLNSGEVQVTLAQLRPRGCCLPNPTDWGLQQNQGCITRKNCVINGIDVNFWKQSKSTKVVISSKPSRYYPFNTPPYSEGIQQSFATYNNQPVYFVRQIQ